MKKHEIKILFSAIFLIVIGYFFYYTVYGFRSGIVELRGNAPRGYKLIINTLYMSDSDSCSESDWNTGGRKKSITHIKEKIKYKNGRYSTTFAQKIKKDFCSWSIIYSEINLIYKKETTKKDIKFKNPVFRIIVRPIRKNDYSNKESVKLENGTIKEKFICARDDRLTTDWRDNSDIKYINTSLMCRSKNAESSNFAEQTLKIDDSFDGVKKMILDFEVKDEIYCFVRKRDCPVYAKGIYVGDVESALDIETGKKKETPPKIYKYKIKKKLKKDLLNAINLDSYEYNLTKAKKLLDKNSSIVNDQGNLYFQKWLSNDIARGDINFEALKLLYTYGFNISVYDNEIYLKQDINKIISSFDIDGSLGNEYDYATLPQEVKDELRKHNISLENFYSKKSTKESLFYTIGVYNDDPIKMIKWLLKHGYKAKKGDLEWSLVSALRYNKFINPSKIIKEYIALGANLKNPDVAFPLMATMRHRFDDIETLKTLVNAGVNINATDEYGSTILFSMDYKLGEKYRSACSAEKNKEAIKEYMKLGADINHVNKDGESLVETENACNIEALKELGAIK